MRLNNRLSKSCLAVATVLALVAGNAVAATNPCNPATLFKNLNPGNFLTALNACEGADIAAAIALAQAPPQDDVALSCLVPLQAIASSKTNGGLLTAFEAFRRAKMSGFVSSCSAWVASIPLLP